MDRLSGRGKRVVGSRIRARWYRDGGPGRREAVCDDEDGREDSSPCGDKSATGSGRPKVSGERGDRREDKPMGEVRGSGPQGQGKWVDGIQVGRSGTTLLSPRERKPDDEKSDPVKDQCRVMVGTDSGRVSGGRHKVQPPSTSVFIYQSGPDSPVKPSYLRCGSGRPTVPPDRGGLTGP